MLDYVDYTIDGDWAIFYKVARGFRHRVKPEDREDLNHTIILSLAQAQLRLDNDGGGQLSDVAMLRIASYQVTEYWVKQRRLTTWLDCGHCSKEQRQKCRSEDLYSQCPKYHQLVSLNTKADGDGEPSELIEFLADDKAVDLDAWVDARRILRGLPRRLVQIGYKRYSGIPLDRKERNYFNHQVRQLKQKALF